MEMRWGSGWRSGSEEGMEAMAGMPRMAMRPREDREVLAVVPAAMHPSRLRNPKKFSPAYQGRK
jgi:hypothetical protein